MSVGRAVSTSSLRAQRSNPESFCGGILDCFVASAQNCSAILSRAPRNDEIATAVLYAHRHRPA
ncbi:hypothetical protein C7G42_11720 [Bradyrhizobium sp. MOS003]|nr:hypothetical protein C7G42_11720 [Bradyrhizobium sp. MOS003]